VLCDIRNGRATASVINIAMAITVMIDLARMQPRILEKKAACICLPMHISCPDLRQPENLLCHRGSARAGAQWRRIMLSIVVH